MLTVIDAAQNGAYKFPPHLREEMALISTEFDVVERVLRECCPGCGGRNYTYAFPKKRTHYVRCDNCSSIYAQNILSSADYHMYKKEVFNRVYESEAYRSFVGGLSADYFFHLSLTFERLFGKQDGVRSGVIGIRTPVMRELVQKSMKLSILSDWGRSNHCDKFDFLFLHHVLERDVAPIELLDQAFDSLEAGGYLYIKARVGSGIDLLTLWENTAIMPFEHLNLITIEGVKEMLGERFTISELSTPGALDMSNIMAAGDEKLNQFMRYLKQHRSERTIDEFQQFIQKNLLSSYMVIVAQKEWHKS